MRVNRWVVVVAGCVVAASSAMVQGQTPAPPAAPQPTLWSFLGIPQTAKRLNETLVNRSGNHPRLEKKPPLKKIADPENLKSSNPAIKKAAEIKQQEDLAKQKIKAIKYLTEIGCGCYNLDGSITEALLAALEDCTESVRLAAAEAIGEAASGESCANCKQRSCCNKQISEKLSEIAFEKDDEGCWKEPSERVREAAAAALHACCPGHAEEGETPVVPETPETPELPGRSLLRDPETTTNRRKSDEPLPAVTRRPTLDPSAQSTPRSSRRGFAAERPEVSLMTARESIETLTTKSVAENSLRKEARETIETVSVSTERNVTSRGEPANSPEFIVKGPKVPVTTASVSSDNSVVPSKRGAVRSIS
ncbi:MAG TPA: hypothetical protein PLV92_23355, partial [Pirellulaceae bacterium]|nr:hypothetical protein [Pirellulaceae bacterium]